MQMILSKIYTLTTASSVSWTLYIGDHMSQGFKQKLYCIPLTNFGILGFILVTETQIFRLGWCYKQKD